MSTAAIAGIIGIVGSVIGFLIKWYWGNEQAKQEAAAAEKKAEADAELKTQDQKKNQQAINDSIRKQMDTADQWKGKP